MACLMEWKRVHCRSPVVGGSQGFSFAKIHNAGRATCVMVCGTILLCPTVSASSPCSS